MERRFCKAALKNAFGGSLYIDEVETKESLFNALDSAKYDLIITDYLLCGFTGLDVINALKPRNLDIPVIVYTSHGSEETAVKVMRSGAADYINKSLRNIDKLPAIVNRILKSTKIESFELTGKPV